MHFNNSIAYYCTYQCLQVLSGPIGVDFRFLFFLKFSTVVRALRKMYCTSLPQCTFFFHGRPIYAISQDSVINSHSFTPLDIAASLNIVLNVGSTTCERDGESMKKYVQCWSR